MTVLDPPGKAELQALGYELKTVPAGTILWRIHSTSSAPAVPWNRPRTFGPVPSARWDPHPMPRDDAAPAGGRRRH